MSEDDNKKLLKIGELAGAVGKTQRALHLYEELGILQPVTRSSGGFRLYGPDALERAMWIGKLQGMGFKLSEIKQILADWEGSSSGPDGMSRLRAIFEGKLQQTRETIERMRELERDLHDSLAYLDSCNTCAPSHSTDDCAVCAVPGHDPMDTPTLVAGLAQANKWDVDAKNLKLGN